MAKYRSGGSSVVGPVTKITPDFFSVSMHLLRRSDRNEGTCCVSGTADMSRSSRIDRWKNTDLAAAALLDLGQRSPKTSFQFQCIVCGEVIQTKRPVKYQLEHRITQCTVGERELVRLGRKHCQDFHREMWIWNLVPDSGWLTHEDQRVLEPSAPLDMLIHQAMYNAAKKTPVPIKADLDDLILVFCDRMSAARAWLNWCSTAYIRQSKSQGTSDMIRETAYERLNVLLSSAHRRLHSPSFMELARSMRRTLFLNSLQLYFLEIGRYKKCDLFVEGSLAEWMRRLPPIE
jgi:hypothetical protein